MIVIKPCKFGSVLTIYLIEITNMSQIKYRLTAKIGKTRARTVKLPQRNSAIGAPGALKLTESKVMENPKLYTRPINKPEPRYVQ